MKKQLKSSETSETTTQQEIVKNNLIKCLKEVSLNENYNYRSVVKVIKKMLNVFIKTETDYIPIKDFAIFLGHVPDNLWAKNPVMYYNENKWDALGFVGERLGKSTVRTKYLELCFRNCGLRITECLDNEDDMFNDIIDNKMRFIKYLSYIEKKITVFKMKELYSLSKKLSDERNYYY
jgi:hypothetical protein